MDIEARPPPTAPAVPRRRAPAGSDTAAGVPPGPEAAAAMRSAAKAAGRSVTAKRDALARDLQRLLEVARKLAGAGGDLRSSADALQDLARQIAKVARALAEAERALPASQRRGAPAAAVPAAPGPAAAAAEAEPRAEPEAPAPGVAEEEDAPAGSARSGTAGLLKSAAGVLKKMLETVRAAEAMERLLDPEAAKARAEAGREVEGYMNELAALALGLEEPPHGGGLDVRA